MSKHYANANWEGNLLKGKGKYTLKTSGYEGNTRFSTRFEDDKTASSPEDRPARSVSICDRPGNVCVSVGPASPVLAATMGLKKM